MSFRPSSYHDEKVVIILVALEQGILSLQCVFVSSNCAAYVGTHTEFHFSSDRKKRTRQTCFWHGIGTSNNRNNNTTCMYHFIVGLLNKMRDLLAFRIYFFSSSLK